MPKRSPILAQRLRSLWTPGPRSGATAAHQALSDKGGDFAERLRAAVAKRH